LADPSRAPPARGTVVFPAAGRNARMAVDCYLYLENASGEQIKGESTDLTFKDCIEIFKFDFDAAGEVKAEDVLELEVMKPLTQTVSSSSSSLNGDSMGNAFSELEGALKEAEEMQTGKDSFTFSVEKYIDCASPTLLQTFCRATSGQSQDPPFKNAIVYVVVGGQKRTDNTDPESVSVLVFKFGNLHITSYQLKYTDGLVDEKLTFYFDVFVMTYCRQLPTGGVSDDKLTKGYDFVNAKPMP
jgi:type VI protein secretion system component Hcp